MSFAKDRALRGKATHETFARFVAKILDHRAVPDILLAIQTEPPSPIRIQEIGPILRHGCASNQFRIVRENVIARLKIGPVALRMFVLV